MELRIRLFIEKLCHLAYNHFRIIRWGLLLEILREAAGMFNSDVVNETILTFLWLEDREGKSSYTFWKTLIDIILPNAIVESKKNNSELVKAVKHLKDKESIYIIVYDNSFDNFQVYQEQKRLKNYVDEKENVKMLDIICFEYILIEFELLIEWLYESDDEFLIKRMDVINARDKLVKTIKSGDMNYKAVKEIIEYDSKLERHNIEQLAAKLLYDLTRNTGFETTKKKIGECWIKSCCQWGDRQDDDCCGLDHNRLTIADKMKLIYEKTSLKKEFSRIGLEVKE